MADRRKKSWGTFKNEMKAKRRKTGDGGAKKNEKGNILDRQELVVRLSSEVSGKAQKYTRVGPCKFVQYDEEELSTERRDQSGLRETFLTLIGMSQPTRILCK